MIQDSRVKPLNDESRRSGRYILYWMQAAQRADCNHALEYAIRTANESGVPVVAAFGLTPEFPSANLRHYTFMLEGLRETAMRLEGRGVKFVMRQGSPDEVALSFAPDASMIVADRGYLTIQRKWRENVARKAGCPVIQVESDVVVPVESAADKEQYAAATLRPKITKLLPQYMKPLKQGEPKKDALGLRIEGENPEDIPALLKKIRADESVPPSPLYTGGASQANILLQDFIEHKLDRYADEGNDPSLDLTSHLSPYLHFGQISPLEVALRIDGAKRAREESRRAFLEQLIVRRELSMNFAFYSPNPDSMKCLPDWAVKTLAEHATDEREYVYSFDELESAQTHDPYWNAAQTEMAVIGRMHNYMRMYWGKKIIEWSATPAAAFAAALKLNDKYELDGRDPNGLAGVAWCFGKHDRPWRERKIFGKVRYMNDAGLKRKFNIEEYVRRISDLKDKQQGRV